MSKPLSEDGELDLTFDKWHQAWLRLLDLISAYLPEEFPLWEVHYTFILKNPNRAKLWQVYLAYDAEIRKRSTHFPIDPSKFSIGIWNDLESRYAAKRIMSLMNLDARPLSGSPYPSKDPPRSSNRSSFRPNSNRPEKTGRCFLCGDHSGEHTSRNCSASCNTSGSPCHLFRQGPTGRRQCKSGKSYCFAWNGVASRIPALKENTGVLSAVPSLTMHSAAHPSPDLLIVNTPSISHQWHIMLSNTKVFNEFHDVPIAICFGFDMGITSPPTFTYTPPNHTSALLYPDHVVSHIQNELALHRYSGPFLRSRLEYLIGFFRTSPLGTVLKSPDATSERRIIQDLSFPRDNPYLPSVNDGDAFPQFLTPDFAFSSTLRSHPLQLQPSYMPF
jgi:hypothetical protein